MIITRPETLSREQRKKRLANTAQKAESLLKAKPNSQEHIHYRKGVVVTSKSPIVRKYFGG